MNRTYVPLGCGVADDLVAIAELVAQQIRVIEAADLTGVRTSGRGPPTEAEAWRDPDLGPLVWLAMATGARRGELCALRWRHIDTTCGVMVIRSSIAQAGGQVWEKDTKLHQRHHIALDPVTVAVLTAYHQQRQQRAAAVGVELPDDGFVFSSRADARTCRSPQGMTSQYRRLVSRLGYAPRCTHSGTTRPPNLSGPGSMYAQWRGGWGIPMVGPRWPTTPTLGNCIRRARNCRSPDEDVSPRLARRWRRQCVELPI